MNRILKSSRGVISVFVALMMTGILSLGTFVLEAARLQAARTQLGEAAASAANSMLSSYNADLQARYGILAIDSQRSNEATCTEYVQFNSDLSALAYGNNVTRLYRVEDVDMTGVYNLTYPHILKRQLLTVARYNLPPENSEFNMYNASYILDDIQMKSQYVSTQMAQIQASAKGGSISDVPSQMLNALAALERTFATAQKHGEAQGITLSDGTYAKLPSVTGVVESQIPEGDTDAVNALHTDAMSQVGSIAGILNATAGDVEQTDVYVNLSAMEDLSTYHTTGWQSTEALILAGSLPNQYKAMADTVNAALNILKNSDRDGNLLLNAYIAQMFSNRNYTAGNYVGPDTEEAVPTGDDLTFAEACCEYIFGGSVSEWENQAEAYDYVMAIRLIGNLYAVLLESDSYDVNNLYSVTAHLAWAYYETCVDMQLLTKYNTPVPLTKDRQILSLEDPAAVAAAFAGGKLEEALNSMGYYDVDSANYVFSGIDLLDYTDSLNLSLWLVPNSEKLLRVADLMQLEMRYQQRYVEQIPVTFLMAEQNTYCRVECKARMNAVLPILSIGGENYGLQELPINTLKYAGY